MELTHRSPWNLGNHEDGVLTGLANLLQAWQDVIEKLKVDIPALHALDGVGSRVPCLCTKWRERCKRKRRRERAAHLNQQSDMTILSALPAFQGENALSDGSALRHLVQVGADVVGAVAGGTLQLAQHGAGAAVAVTTRGVEAAVDAAHAARMGAA
ncbi:unnamed protein product [Prorocentrum cordatum]|uniref:Uncharacterized protein n=1 Tax=Prorocentrum cordatum TaxID=2364126 RepID=A0ABN9UMN3_9DINO|nr:unnamed protein product [Polarella glacialis]